MGEPLRYPMPVPEWVRVQWTSESARATWEPRIQAITAAWEIAERASVGRIRDACIQSISPELLPELSARAAEQGLDLIVLGQQGEAGSYQARPVPVEAGAPWTYRIALAVPLVAGDFSEAWHAGDDEAIGRALGFPWCCRQFFRHWWVDEGWCDTTWPMVAPTSTMPAAPQLVTGPVECNILLRWLGVRWVPHLPCAFDCAATAEVGRRFRVFVPDEIAGWMDELLDSPIEWSAWHGIAEIKTPILTISTKTDATAEKLVVRRKGSTYPEAGARGLRFPYHREPERLRAVIDTWTDNGFASYRAMNDAHTVLLARLGCTYGTVVDLGCGNGYLLNLIQATRRVGVESNPQRAERARSRLDRVIVGDCTDPALIARVMAEERPDVLIAQRDRNPPESLPAGVRVLSYSYEAMEASWR